MLVGGFLQGSIHGSLILPILKFYRLALFKTANTHVSFPADRIRSEKMVRRSNAYADSSADVVDGYPRGVTKMAGPRAVKAHLSLMVQWRRPVLLFLISCVGTFRQVSIFGSLILPVLKFCCGHFSKLSTRLFTSALAL